MDYLFRERRQRCRRHWRLRNGTFVDVSQIADPDADPRLRRANLSMHDAPVNIRRHIRRHIRLWWDRTEATGRPKRFARSRRIRPGPADPRGVLTAEVRAARGEVRESTGRDGGVRDVPDEGGT